MKNVHSRRKEKLRILQQVCRIFLAGSRATFLFLEACAEHIEMQRFLAKEGMEISMGEVGRICWLLTRAMEYELNRLAIEKSTPADWSVFSCHWVAPPTLAGTGTRIRELEEIWRAREKARYAFYFWSFNYPLLLGRYFLSPVENPIDRIEEVLDFAWSCGAKVLCLLHAPPDRPIDTEVSLSEFADTPSFRYVDRETVQAVLGQRGCKSAGNGLFQHALAVEEEKEQRLGDLFDYILIQQAINDFLAESQLSQHISTPEMYELCNYLRRYQTALRLGTLYTVEVMRSVAVAFFAMGVIGSRLRANNPRSMIDNALAVAHSIKETSVPHLPFLCFDTELAAKLAEIAENQQVDLPLSSYLCFAIKQNRSWLIDFFEDCWWRGTGKIAF